MFELWKSSSEEFNNLFETGEFSDTEILVGEEPNTKVFKAHSLILKTRSPFFRSAFSSHWIRTENGIITLQKPNISVEVFNILLRYIYTSFIDLTIHDARTNIALLIAADELCLNDLCVYIEGNLIDDEYSLKCNFVLIQKIVNQLSQFKKLLEFYEFNVNMEPTLILRADDFITIQQENFLNFLVDHGQSLNPVEIWDKLIEWATEQSHELSSDAKKWTPGEITTFGTIIQPFIPYINFKGFSITDFCQKVKPFKSVFDNDLYVQILEHYSFNEDVHSKFKMKIDSNIINSCHAFLLGNLIKMAKQDNYNCLYDFKLLVRGSRDGFDTKSFHRCCDEKGPTITVASVKNTNEIVGGFSPLDWNSNYDANTRESFIFSLDKDKLTNFIFSKVMVGKHAIYKRRGPDFGENKSDLRLLEGDSNKKGQCYKNSYEKLIRCNEGEFEIDEYEVFQVINVNQVEEQIEMAPFRPFNPFNNHIPISPSIPGWEDYSDF